MDKFPPPLLGFNNNVRHQGRVFHIQTEDSGVRHARIVTHLFADGGRILKTLRTDYTDKLGRKDMTESLRRLMKSQHKAMFLALRAGDFDAVIGAAFNEDEAHVEVTTKEGSKAHVVPQPPAAAGSRPPPQGDLDADATLEIPTVTRDDEIPSSRPQRSSEVREAVAEVRVGHDGARPASLFELDPIGTRSIFSDELIDEQSLDDAILSYLAEDGAGASSKE